MLDLLILTAGYGEGHNSAARGLLAASEQAGCRAEIADPFTALGDFYGQSRRQYIELINRAPKVWATIYGWVDKIPAVEFNAPMTRPVLEELERIIAEKRPKAVISVYPLYAYFINQLFPASRPFGFHTVITDSITINRVWLRAPSDSYIVPNDATAAVLRDLGVPAAKVFTLGFPVNPAFAGERPKRSDPSEGLRVLFMINAGKDTAPAVVDRLLDVPRIQLSVAVGRDEDLRAKVEAAAAGRPIEIHGWVPHLLPELVMSHHVLIGKAGGATVQEAIAARTPMLITQVVPGQEEGNAQLLFGQNCAALCPTPDALATQVEALAANNSALWREWEANISQISRPAAASQIIEWLSSGAPTEHRHNRQ